MLWYYIFMKRLKQNVLYGIAILAVVGFGFYFVISLHGFFVHLRDGRVAQENETLVQEMFAEQIEAIVSEIEGCTQIEYEMPPQEDSKTVPNLLQEAREKFDNPDIVAYLTIPGTAVGNVVVQGHDNDFYLRRDAFGQSNQAGSLFMHYANSNDFSDPSTIIFGHNMRNGTMFHDLRYFMNQSFAQANPHIILITDYGVLIYEIFATFSAHVTFNYIQVHFKTEAEFGALVQDFMRRSVIDMGIIASPYDNIIILSTCTNIDRDTRFVVVGRLISS